MPEKEQKTNKTLLVLTIISAVVIVLIAVAAVFFFRSGLADGLFDRSPTRVSSRSDDRDDDDEDDDDWDGDRSARDYGDGPLTNLLRYGIGFGGSSTSSGTGSSSTGTAATSGGTAASAEPAYDYPSDAPSASIYNLWALSASSELYEPAYDTLHSVDRMIDSDFSTAWVEGVDGYGYGESVYFEFYEPSVMYGFDIWAGYQKSDASYWDNSRPAAISLYFSDGTYLYYWLDDYYGGQTIYFDSPVYAEWVELVIEDVYIGNVYENTAISDIWFF